MLSDTHFGVEAGACGEIMEYRANHATSKEERDSASDGAEVKVNWRFNWRVELPCAYPVVRLRLFDKPPHKRINDPDLDRSNPELAAKWALSPNDFWAESYINMESMFRLAQRKHESVSFEPPLDRSQDPRVHKSGAGPKTINPASDHKPMEVEMYHQNYSMTQGTALVSLEVLPEAEAFVRKAGQGRSSPNDASVGKIPFAWERLFQYLLAQLKYIWNVHRIIFVGLFMLVLVVIIVATVEQDSW
jgi:hypothetical protein